MANNCAALGTMSRFLVQDGTAPRTFSSTSERYPLLYERLASDRQVQGFNRMTGDLSLWSQGVREKSYIPMGAIAMQPGPADLVKWLPRILGGTFSTNTITVGNTLPTFDILADRENDIFLYTNCVVAQAIFTASMHLNSPEDEMLEMILMIVAETETKGQTWPVSEPALPTTGDFIPYNTWEGALTLDALATQFDTFNLMIDNNLLIRARGSQTPNCIRSQGRRVRLQTRNPFTAATIGKADSLYTTGAAGSLVFTNGTLSTTFTFPHLRNEFQTPTVNGKTEIPLALSMHALRTASGSPELTIVNDSTL